MLSRFLGPQRCHRVILFFHIRKYRNRSKGRNRDPNTSSLKPGRFVSDSCEDDDDVDADDDDDDDGGSEEMKA